MRASSRGDAGARGRARAGIGAGRGRYAREREGGGTHRDGGSADRARALRGRRSDARRRGARRIGGVRRDVRATRVRPGDDRARPRGVGGETRRARGGRGAEPRGRGGRRRRRHRGHHRGAKPRSSRATERERRPFVRRAMGRSERSRPARPLEARSRREAPSEARGSRAPARRTNRGERARRARSGRARVETSARRRVDRERRTGRVRRRTKGVPRVVVAKRERGANRTRARRGICERGAAARATSVPTGAKKKSPGRMRTQSKSFGDEGHRSPYLLHAKQTLYHLSYAPRARMRKQSPEDPRILETGRARIAAAERNPAFITSTFLC